MKEEEREKIRRNLHDLVRNTVCSVQLHAYLVQQGVLIREEVDIIDSKPTPGDKAMELYKIIRTKADYQKPFFYLIEGLKETNQTEVVGILDPSEIVLRVKRLLEGSRESTCKRVREEHSSGIRFRVRVPVQHFTGRRHELQELHSKIGRSGVTVVTSVSGLGGIGKTQLARQYIHEHSGDFDENIIWLNAEAEEVLSNSFRVLAKDKLRITTEDANKKEMDITSIVSNVYEWFEGKRCLFVFDNAGAVNYIRNFLPMGSSQEGLSVLITTRDSKHNWDCGEHFIKLKEMRMEDAIEFVMKGLSIVSPTETMTKNITALCTRLQRFPLAIQQAISYIKEQNELDTYSIPDYLDEFERYQKELLDSDAFQGLFNDYDKTTFTTWKMTMKRIEECPVIGYYSSFIIKCMAYLSPENLEQAMFLPAIDNGRERDLKNSFGLLVRYSMIDRDDEKQGMFSIHRLVQEVTRIELAEGSHEEIVVRFVLHLVSKTPICAAFTDHTKVAWFYACRHPSIVKDYSHLPTAVVKHLYGCSKFAEAHLFFTGETGRGKLVEILPTDHESILLLDQEMCNVQIRLGNYEEAKTKLLELIEKCHRLGNEKLAKECEYSLGELYITKQKYDEAVKIYLKLLEWKKGVVGMDQEEIAVCLQNIGECYSEMGNVEEATKYLEEALEKYGEASPKAADVLLSIANLKEKSGKTEEAAEITRKLLERRNELSDRLKLMVCQAAVDRLHKQEKFSEALEICDEVFAMKEIDPMSVNIFLGIVKLKGSIMRELGRYEEAVALHTQVYDELVKMLGQRHPATALLKLELLLTKLYQGKTDEAVNSFLSDDSFSFPIGTEDTSSIEDLYVKFALTLLEKQGDVSRSISVMETLRNRMPEGETKSKLEGLCIMMKFAELCGRTGMP